MTVDERVLRNLLDAPTRMDLWVSVVQAAAARNVSEIGDFRGNFAAQLLAGCDSIQRYYMVDPWRHLDDWNKPSNKSDKVFERFYRETMDKTEEYAAKRIVLRGRTIDIIDEIPEGSLDFVYIDGDHTLRGIAVDLIKVYPKVRQGGLIGGDDFSAARSGSTTWLTSQRSYSLSRCISPKL
jgi:Methyltransferase domain